ncbi:unnamed protein product [Pseudo-nitzschia multistriata]|uniref:J domain-containing protein n=1 Tax=Pseudo-nitzschia multistriata TaxID=183589 RepID=A0A448ZLN4_9STRA|nr:unnamed protein product [Pseudo-nitzschia multistriata]
MAGEHGEERKEDDTSRNGIDHEDDDDSSSPNLYSILNLSRDATTDEVHRSYRTLSTTFHPDKVRLRQQTGQTPATLITQQETDKIQETFLQFKRAHDVLIDPVLRLAYDCYGEDGVELIRKVQQQQRDEKTRREEAAREQEEGKDDNGNANYDDFDEQDDDSSDYDDDDCDDDDDDAWNLYEKLEHLLVVQKDASGAKEELRKFMEQHDYLQNLTEDNCVHLNLSMTFPPVVPLKPVLYQGRDYLRFVQKKMLSSPPVDEEEKQYLQQRILQERRLVDYQISQLRSSQKADVGFTLTSVVQPSRNKSTHSDDSDNNNPIRQQPSKWSMAVGCSTDLIYPGVAELTKMAAIAKDPKKKDYQTMAEKHPITMFVNTSYQAAPTTQIFGTANLNNDNESHQYSLGSTHTFSNQTACRYGMTILSRSPLPDDDPVIFNLKTYRHLQGIGTTSVGLSAGSNGRILQWNASWQATLSSFSKLFQSSTPQQQQHQQNRFSHKVLAKASVGMLQGNSLEFGYKCKFPKKGESRNNEQNSSESNLWTWLEENFTLPKKAELTTVWGHFSKLNAMVTHEITSLATHPTLAFGLEHDISLGRWAWIWEIQYNNSTFRIPIPVLQLGSVTNYQAFYSQKFYYGIYCLCLQSMVADLLEETGGGDRKASAPTSNNNSTNDANYGISPGVVVSRRKGGVFLMVKTKSEAERQLALMKPVAEKKIYREMQRQFGTGKGLIVLTATYWHRMSHNSSIVNGSEDNNHSEYDNKDPSLMVHEVVSMDATVQLQFWVLNGKLVAPSGIPKSSWMGFYTLATESKFRKNRRRFGRNQKSAARRWLSIGCRRFNHFLNQLSTIKTTRKKGNEEDDLSRSNDPQEEEGPRLTVRYSYNGNVYEISVGETEGFNLPCEDDDRVERLGDAAFLQ